ncbi:hypothetical protein KR093_002599 [Drosophila rubida]|uniref:aralkylamine N-acetyltransferase n=1 Tax=Drosophila rubida TaxID=30044 RepID=A0AAD4K9C2_9MUSC|nr:hypothetical protein KR093_002599 [Drosophila rubida]
MSSTAAVNDSNDSLEIKVATADDTERLMQFLHAHYYREEPLTVGCPPPEPDAEDEAFLLSNLPHGTCLMALCDGRIVGAAVAGPKLPDEAAHLFEEAARLSGTKWGRILGFLAIVERDANVFERLQVPKALHLHALGVDSTLRGRRIGESIVTALSSRARELGYPALTTDCTSFYSARLMERLNFQLLNTLPYTGYVDAAGVQLIKPPAPHEHVKTYVLRL